MSVFYSNFKDVDYSHLTALSALSQPYLYSIAHCATCYLSIFTQPKERGKKGVVQHKYNVCYIVAVCSSKMYIQISMLYRFLIFICDCKFLGLSLAQGFSLQSYTIYFVCGITVIFNLYCRKNFIIITEEKTCEDTFLVPSQEAQNF